MNPLKVVLYLYLIRMEFVANLTFVNCFGSYGNFVSELFYRLYLSRFSARRGVAQVGR